MHFSPSLQEISLSSLTSRNNNNIVTMPLELNQPVAKWMKGFNLIHSDSVPNAPTIISFNDQLYFENGYLIGQLLRQILKAKGFTSEALMKIRKIAHISSNQNWRIIKEIMEEIHFEQEIDPHNITIELIQNIIYFLYAHFAPKSETRFSKKQKRSFIEPGSFVISKSIEESYNLLEFQVLAFSKIFSITLEECLGLLVDNCKHWKKAVIHGTNNNGFESIVDFYKLMAQNMALVNSLIQQEKYSEFSFMNSIGLAVLSQSSEVAEIGCIVIDNLNTNDWIQQQGHVLLLRSSYQKALDLLLRKIKDNFGIVFNDGLSAKFTNKYMELTTYGKLLKYLYTSIHHREIFQLLSLSYYLKQAFEIFQPETIKQQKQKLKFASRNLMSVAMIYFWGRLQYDEKNKICFSFQPQFCYNEQERLGALCLIFQIIGELSLRETEFVQKFYRLINKYYNKGSIDIRTFILNNLTFLYKNNPNHFPIGFFLQTYQITNPVQHCDYELIELLSKNRGLSSEEATALLKICTIYYYQQLQSACFIQPISNLLKNYLAVEWAKQLSEEILNKWPNLPIPPFQMVPQNSNKIKFRSIGLKKKEMLQFTQLNRYKNILKLLPNVRSSEFLFIFGRQIVSTISKVQKSKIKEMQNTKIFLNSLLASVDILKIQLKQQKLHQIRSKSQTVKIETISDNINTDPFLQQYDRLQQLNTPINILQNENQQNQFMKDQQPPFQSQPLLPFSELAIEDLNEKKYYDENLFQNYQVIFIKNMTVKYQSLIKTITEIYNKSANLQHFLKNLNILNYFQKQLSTLYQSEDRLKLMHDNTADICSKLIIEMALLLFQFKRSRRITIKCIQSFYEILSDKVPISNGGISTVGNSFNKQVQMNAKIDFKYQITNRNIQSNHSAEKYIICFQVVGQLLKKAIGVHTVQPISCIISQILPNNEMSSSKVIKDTVNNRVSEIQQREFEQLQRMIEDQSKLQPVKPANFSTPLKASKNKVSLISNSNQMRGNGSQKWSQVQKKVLLRRRELEGKQKAINES